jgi:hypothetical protein
MQLAAQGLEAGPVPLPIRVIISVGKISDIGNLPWFSKPLLLNFLCRIGSGHTGCCTGSIGLARPPP